MRLSEDRYSRDLRRLELAVRLVRHEVRTRTIMTWTGLTEDRIRRVFRSVRESGAAGPVRRHRGPSPHSVSMLLRQVAIRGEAASVLATCEVFGALPKERGPAALAALPSLARGERLCGAYEAYRAEVPRPELSFEQVLLIVRAVVEGQEVELGTCGSCGAAIVIDRLSTARRLCQGCLTSAAALGVRRDRVEEGEEFGAVPPGSESLVYQHRLFDG